MAYLGRQGVTAPLTSADIPDNSITSAKIVAGTVTASDVASDVATQVELETVETTVTTNATNARTDIITVRQDLNIVALREAIAEDRVANNLPNSFIDQFQDNSGIQTETTGDRNESGEYWSSTTDGNIPSATTNLLLHFDNTTDDSSGNSNDPTHTSSAPPLYTNSYKFGTHSAYFDGSKYLKWNQGDGGVWFGSGDWAYDSWVRVDSNSASGNYRSYWGHSGQDSQNYHQLNNLQQTLYFHTYNDVLDTTDNLIVVDTWFHILVQRYNNNLKIWKDGNLCAPTGGLSLSKNFNTTSDWVLGWDEVQTYKFVGYIDEWRLSKFAPTVTVGDPLYMGNATGNFTPPTSAYVPSTFSGTATLEGIRSTPSSAVTKVSGVMLYKDNAGTAVPGTQLQIWFTCNGSDYVQAASYTAVTPVFSSGIKMVKLGETTCTGGTDVRYKAIFASQVSGSMDTQLYGVGLNY